MFYNTIKNFFNIKKYTTFVSTNKGNSSLLYFKTNDMKFNKETNRKKSNKISYPAFVTLENGNKKLMYSGCFSWVCQEKSNIVKSEKLEIKIPKNYNPTLTALDYRLVAQIQNMR